MNLPEPFFVIQLNDVPVSEPLVAQELGHVVPDGVRENDDAFLSRRERRGGPDGNADGGSAAAAAKHPFVTDQSPEEHNTYFFSTAAFWI